MEKLLLRSTTKKMISNLDDETKSVVNNYIRTILSLSESQAFEVIKSIKISPKSLIGKTILSDNSFYCDPKFITEEIITKTYTDIVNNYKYDNPYCWLTKEDELFDECLRDEFDEDKTLMTIIYITVEKRFKDRGYNPLNLNRLKDLLNNVDDEKKRFGGLMELGFSKADGDYFKNHTFAIWKFIENEYINKKKDNESMEPDNKKEEGVSNMTYEHAYNKPTAGQVINNSKLFIELFKATEEAKKANQAFNAVIAKFEAVKIDPYASLEQQEKIEKLLVSVDEYEL